MPDRINMIGVPFDAKSSFLNGPAKGPSAIREVLFSGASNLFSETGVDLDSVNGFKKVIDLKIENSDAGYLQIEGEAEKQLS
ncbi:MAG TPA: hypothetical protein QGF40_00240, partial [Candidatus Marinimicrobia bacterium]|nr:hypothetical protein [Candidatus Neomarinimicrobiota bacterium]